MVSFSAPGGGGSVSGPCSGGVLGLVNLGLGLAGLEVVPGGGTATVSSPVPSRGSLGLASVMPPTLTVNEEEEAASGETNEDLIAAAAGTLRGDFSDGGATPGDFSLGSRALSPTGV